MGHVRSPTGPHLCRGRRRATRQAEFRGGPRDSWPLIYAHFIAGAQLDPNRGAAGTILGRLPLTRRIFIIF